MSALHSKSSVRFPTADIFWRKNDKAAIFNFFYLLKLYRDAFFLSLFCGRAAKMYFCAAEPRVERQLRHSRNKKQRRKYISIQLQFMYQNDRILSKFPKLYLFCLYFATEPQRRIFVQQSRMYKCSCGIAATKRMRA